MENNPKPPLDFVWQQFVGLGPEAQGAFLDRAKQLVKLQMSQLGPGATVQFRLKSGEVATGRVVRMKLKRADVEVTRVEGRTLDHPLVWNVPFEMLRLVTP